MRIVSFAPLAAFALCCQSRMPPAAPEDVPIESSRTAGAPATPTAADLEAVRLFLADAKANVQSEAGAERAPWYVANSWCQSKLGLTVADFNSCTVEPLSGDRAALATVIFECADEHCDVGRWVVVGEDGPIKVDDDGGTLPVVSPDGRFVFLASAELAGPALGYQARLVRVSLSDGKRDDVAACAAAALAPSGNALACRDLDGNVYRLPFEGGALELIHRVELGGERVGRDPHQGVYLTPVSFTSPDHFTVTTITASGGERTEEATWPQPPEAR